MKPIFVYNDLMKFFSFSEILVSVGDLRMSKLMKIVYVRTPFISKFSISKAFFEK